MSPQPEDRRSSVDDGQRLNDIRRRLQRDEIPTRRNVDFLLNHIDTLTAKVQRLESAAGEQTEMARRWKNRAQSNLSKVKAARAERDALRSLMRQVVAFVGDDPWITDSFRRELRDAAVPPDNSPEPVEPPPEVTP